MITSNCDCDGGVAWHGDDQVDLSFSQEQVERNQDFSEFMSGLESKPSQAIARDVLHIIEAAKRDNMREYEYISERLKTNLLYLPEGEKDQVNEWLTNRGLQKIFL